jgi:hypothetical protein
MARKLTGAQMRSLLNDMKILLEEIEAGDLQASRSLALRIEGAITALKAVLGDSDVSKFV